MPLLKTSDVTDRVRRLNFLSLGIVVTYAIIAGKLVSNRPVVNPLVDSALVFLTSIGFYQILVEVLFEIVGKFGSLLKIYWGSLYLHGLWSYTYTIDGADGNDDKVFFGIWRFEQTLYDTRIVGFGLTDKFIARSRVRSVTEMIANGVMYEFINVRSDSIDPSRDVYSRTSMYFELNKNWFFRYPTRMRGQTMVYGGPFNGRVYNNVFVKHESARTEEDVIADLKRKPSSHDSESIEQASLQ
jgi:hypothetical protein